MSFDNSNAIGEVVGIESLTSWKDEPNPFSSADASNSADFDVDKYPYPPDADYNSRIYLYPGPVYEVSCDAIVNPMEGAISEKRGISANIHRIAGAQLEIDLLQLAAEANPTAQASASCRTGSHLVTKGYKLPCRRVVHTVGPRYEARYKTAAENVLHKCYRECLQALVEQNLHTIAFAPIHNAERKKFPVLTAVPIVLRTLRRFFERCKGYSVSVVLCIPLAHEMTAYREQLSVFFPRSAAEAAASVPHLPEDLGNEYGEASIPDRSIRIGLSPEGEDTVTNRAAVGRGISSWSADTGKMRFAAGTRFNATNVQYSETGDVSAEAEVPEGADIAVAAVAREEDIAAFCAVHPNPDDFFKGKVALDGNSREANYQRLYRTALSTPLIALEKSGVIVKAPGKDTHGHPFVCIFGCNFPAKVKHDPDLVLLFIRICDSIAKGPYSVIYFHSKKFVTIHPTMYSRMAAYVFRSRNMKATFHSLSSITELWEQQGFPQHAFPPYPEAVVSHEVTQCGTSRCVQRNAWPV